MSRFTACLLAFSLLAVSPAQADEAEVSVAEFLETWSKIDSVAIQKELEETGTLDLENHPAAKLSSDRVEKIANAYRAQVNAERSDGRTPDSCLPEGEAEIDSDDLLTHLETYTESERSELSLADAFAQLMRKTYPCS